MWRIYNLFVGLGHGIQRATVLEPLNLAGVEGVGQLDLEGLAILRLDDHGDGLARLELSGLDVNLFSLVSRSICERLQIHGRTLASVGILS